MSVMQMNTNKNLIEIAFTIEHLSNIINDPVQWETFRGRLNIFLDAQKQRFKEEEKSQPEVASAG